MKFAILHFALLAILLIPFPAFSQTSRSVAVTFDDLPATGGASNLERLEEINRLILGTLKREKIPAAGFVVESRLYYPGEIDERTAILKRWLDDGHILGNHTFSHIAINSNSFEDYTEDLIRGETITRMLLRERGKELKYYRHTQLRTGPTDEYRERLAKFLKERGYTVAPVTIDNNEYIFAAVYKDARERGDRAQMKRIADSYVAYMEEIFGHFEKLSRDFLGREIPQVLLLHANEINADHFGALAAMIKARGYRFITLDEALKDEAYRRPDVTSRRGLSWLHRWMIAEGKEIREEPGVPSWISELFATR